MHAPGAPAGSYTLSEFETVNLYNGHINFAIPLALPGGRGKSGSRLVLRVDQHYWNTAYVPPDNEAGDPGGPYGRNDEFDGIKGTFGVGGMYGETKHDELCQPNSNFAVYALMRLYLQTPDGTLYEFRTLANNGQPYHISCSTTGISVGTNFIAADGSATTFVSDVALRYLPYPDPASHRPSGFVKFADGTHYRVDNGNISWMRDPNGNKTSFTYEGYGLLNYPPAIGLPRYSFNRLTSITDSLNRQVTICYAGSQACSNNTFDQITYKGFGGATRTVKVKYNRLNNVLRQDYSPVANLFPELRFGSGPGPYNPEKVSEIELPDSRRYRLFYNPHGELARVELPTGGAHEYDHTPGSGVVGVDPFAELIYRRMVKRRVYPNGGAGNAYEQETVFEDTYDYTTSPPTTVITEKNYNSLALGRTLVSSMKHYYHHDPRQTFGMNLHYTPWMEGREYKTEVLDPATGSPLAEVRQQWSQREPISWWASPFCHGISCSPAYAPSNHPRVVEAVTTLNDTNQVAKWTAINPQNGSVGFDQYNNPTDIWEYDYGVGAAGALMRYTHTEYLTAGYDGSAGPHLRKLPRLRQVYDYATGAARLAAQVETRYDEFTLHWYGTVVQWVDPGTTRGNPTTVRRWLDTTGIWLEHRTEYDQCGNVRKSWDARPNRAEQERVTEVTYSDNFSDNTARNTFAYPTGTVSPVPDMSGQRGSSTRLTTATAYDFWSGLAVVMTDANGQTTTTEYNDDLDRLTAVVRPAGGGRTDYEYDDTIGNLHVRALSDLDAARRLETKQYFDGLGRSVRTFSLDPQEPSAQWLTVDTVYDALGREWKVSSPYRSAGPGSPINPSGHWTELTFDGMSRVTRARTTADNAVVVTSYAGNRTTITDQDGRKRRSITDAVGRLVRVDEPNTAGDLGTIDSPTQPTHYLHDGLGLLRRVTQGQQQRFFMYDSLGRVIRAKNPEQNAQPAFAATDPVTGNTQWSLSYAYDENGNLISRTDARGVTTTYGYDNVKRNTTVRYTDGTKPIDRFYDGAVNGRGRFYYSNWDPADNTKYETHLAIDEYDAMGRVKRYRQHFLTGGVASPPFNVTRNYDLSGNVLSQTYPSGRVVSYTYDDAGRLSSFSGNLGDAVQRDYATGVIYDQLGGLRQERFGTDTPVYNKRFYNARGQLSEIRVSTHSITAPGQETNWNRGALINHYSHQSWAQSGTDNNGSLRKQDVYIPNDDAITGYSLTTFFYEYDWMNRLDAMREVRNGANSFLQDYNYDRWGNRTINATNSWGVPAPQFGVDPNTNRLSAPAGSGSVMGYDNAGNLTTDTYTGQGTRAFDAEGRTTTAQDSWGMTSGYSYDADGRRVKRRVAGGPEVWDVYGMEGELLAEYAANDSVFSPQKEYGYRGGELLVAAAAPLSLGMTNAGFESPALGAGTFQYAPANATWTFAGAAGISANGSGFTAGNPGAPEGAQVAFIQGGNTSYFTQQRKYKIGATYVVKFWAAQRGNAGQPGQDFDVYFNGALLGTFRPSGASYQELTTAAFTTNTTFNTLKFVGRNSFGGDNTAFIDNVRVLSTSVGPGQSAVTQFSATQNPSGAWAYGYKPAGGSFTTYGGTSTFFGAGTNTWALPGQACCPMVTKNNTASNYTYPTAQSVVHPPDVLNLHPGPNNERSVLRWTAPAAGTYTIQGRFQGIDNLGTTSDVAITLNGVTIFSGNVNGYGAQAPFALTKTVAAGEAVEFSVGFGSNGNYSSDSTGLAVTINSLGLFANVQWLVKDQIGANRMILDSTGSLVGVKRQDFLPFGEEVLAGAGGRTITQGYSVSTGLRQKWAQLERDDETNLDYAVNRFYSFSQGRFTGVDPGSVGANVENPQTWNAYTYALNNPMVFNDPDGLDTRICDLEGRCHVFTDSEANGGLFNKKWQRENGHTVRKGKIYQNGQMIGTYENINITGAPYSGAINEVGRRPIARTFVYLYGSSVTAGLATPLGANLLWLRFAGEAFLIISPPESSGPAMAGSITTESETRNGALREAKRVNGVPVSQQPRVITPNSAEGAAVGLRPGENIRLYEYTNTQGQRIWIREDGAVTYPDGGTQRRHFNSGPADGPRGQKSLMNHHNFGGRRR